AEPLRKADAIKLFNHDEFSAILKASDQRSDELQPEQRWHLRYLQGWNRIYDGDYEDAIPLLKAVLDESSDLTLRFRAGATIVNVLSFAKRYDEAFSRLTKLLELLPQITDQEARAQGFGVAAFLYTAVGQYDLGRSYAQNMMDLNWASTGICRGGELKLSALQKSGQLAAFNLEFAPILDACVRDRDAVRTGLIRSYATRIHLEQGRNDEAIKLLNEHYTEVRQTNYPQLIATHESLLAQAYRQAGNLSLSRQFALATVASSAKNEYTESLARGYRLLYEIAKAQGDTKTALGYYEQFVAADRGYLSDESARQLAFQRAKHELTSHQLKISSLNRQNEVLQLERKLDTKAVENIRLYVAILMLVVFFIGLWAYKTKRSQLHFMKLSRRDGLTGIFNRPHFMELAEVSLRNSRRMRQEACVVLCDLDHFKSVNDRFGHAEGDVILKNAVQACLVHLRATDVFARVGGEEFGLLLPGCNIEDARLRADQLRTAIAGSMQGADDAKRSKVSASFGIAGTHDSGYELRDLLMHADAALTHAKHAGRNRVVVYDGKDSTKPPSARVYANHLKVV
ncbi:MAG TPA: diguanylate cyclase, partial [Steroidobacteraceae bacterium]|nr:diguanylate cyclase [Steroidobacteraceae bacterium]